VLETWNPRRLRRALSVGGALAVSVLILGPLGIASAHGNSLALKAPGTITIGRAAHYRVFGVASGSANRVVTLFDVRRCASTWKAERRRPRLGTALFFTRRNGSEDIHGAFNFGGVFTDTVRQVHGFYVCGYLISGSTGRTFAHAAARLRVR